MNNILWLVQVTFLYALTFPLALLPLKIALKVGSLIGVLGFYLWRSRRRIAIDNISHVLSNGFIKDNREPSDIIKENFKNLGKSLIEIIKIYHGFGRKIMQRIEIRGLEHYQRAKEKGKGVFLITGHCGNWELLALTASYRISPISVVTRPINNPYINRLIEKVRRRYGNSVIYKRGALKEMLSHFRKEQVIGILIDQSVLLKEGVLIRFLGRPAWTMKSPALVARKTGTPVVPVFIKRNENGHLIEIHPEVALSSNEDPENALIEDTKRFTIHIEDYICSNCTEWLWVHRRWKRKEMIEG